MYKNIPSLKSLLTFAVAARSLNFSQAAEQLFITQSAISHQIKNLEKALGCELFVRDGKQLKLTDNGKKLAQTVQQSLSQIDTVIGEMTGQTNQIIQFGVSSSFAIHRLVPRLNELLEQAPNLDIRLKMISCHDPLAELDLDIILHDNPIDHVAYRCQLLKQELFFPVANAALASQLLNQPLTRWPTLTKLMDIQGFTTWQDWFEFDKIAVEPLTVQYFSHTILVIKAILAGQGIAFMGETLIKEELAQGELIKLSDQALTFTDEGFYFSYHKRRAKDANIRKIRYWLQDLIA